MRLSELQKTSIKQHARDIFGEDAQVMVFGSRLNDATKGGDLDLLIVTNHNVPHPPMQAARLATRISRMMSGSKVDVLSDLPTLQQQPIHQIARQTGVAL